LFRARNGSRTAAIVNGDLLAVPRFPMEGLRSPRKHLASCNPFNSFNSLGYGFAELGSSVVLFRLERAGGKLPCCANFNTLHHHWK
jgi:hypothetical protein